MRFSRVITPIIIVLLTADALLLLAFTPARLLALSAMGRSGCPLDSTLESFGNAKKQYKWENYFKQNSKVIRRDPTGFDLWETPRGQFWVPKGDVILPMILAEQELRIYGVGDRGVHPGDVVLDCGANVGMFSKTALASGASLVIAIEPAPRTLECLRRNLSQEIAQKRVIVYPKGVWDRDDVLNLALNDDNNGANSVVMDRDRPRSVSVPLTTIDKLVAELKLERVDFIKMDIEGAEKQALKGAHGTIDRFHPRMSISSEHLPDDVEAIPALVKVLRPSYKLEFADCQDQGKRVIPLVLEFF